MIGVADFLIAVANLIEAEGRTLRRSVLRLAVGCLLVIAAVGAVAGTFALMTWAVYLLCLIHIGPVLAAFIAGIADLIVAVILLGTAYLLNR